MSGHHRLETVKARRKAAEREHTVSVDALGVTWEDDDVFEHMHEALVARQELLGRWSAPTASAGRSV